MYYHVKKKNVTCVPYAFEDMNIPALRDKMLCKMYFWEKENDINKVSASIICERNDSIIGMTFSKAEIMAMAVTSHTLTSIIEEYNKKSQTENEYDKDITDDM